MWTDIEGQGLAGFGKGVVKDMYHGLWAGSKKSEGERMVNELEKRESCTGTRELGNQ